MVADREEPVPGYWAGDPPGSPPEGPGREGRCGGTGDLLGTAPDSGKDRTARQLIFWGELWFSIFCHYPPLALPCCLAVYLHCFPPPTESCEFPGQRLPPAPQQLGCMGRFCGSSRRVEARGPRPCGPWARRPKWDRTPYPKGCLPRHGKIWPTRDVQQQWREMVRERSWSE